MGNIFTIILVQPLTNGLILFYNVLFHNLGIAILVFILFLQHSLANWKRIHDPYLKAIVLTFAVTVVGLLPATSVNPIFAESYWSPLLGIMIGINEVIYMLNQDPKEATGKLT